MTTDGVTAEEASSVRKPTRGSRFALLPSG